MKLKLILIVVFAIIWCVGCNEEDVDTNYRLFAEDLIVKLNGDLAGDDKMTTKFEDFLTKNEYLIQFQFSGTSRKENNDKALARFEEKYKSLQQVDLVKVLSLTENQSVTVTFIYSLVRGEELVGESKEVSLTTEKQTNF